MSLIRNFSAKQRIWNFAWCFAPISVTSLSCMRTICIWWYGRQKEPKMSTQTHILCAWMIYVLCNMCVYAVACVKPTQRIQLNWSKSTISTLLMSFSRIRWTYSILTAARCFLISFSLSLGLLCDYFRDFRNNDIQRQTCVTRSPAFNLVIIIQNFWELRTLFIFIDFSQSLFAFKYSHSNELKFISVFANISCTNIRKL